MLISDYQTSSIRRSRLIARDALASVWSVADALLEVRRRSKVARLVCIRFAILTLVIFPFRASQAGESLRADRNELE
jgi:hypothetical protein